MFQNITRGPLRVPEKLSAEAKDLLIKLLNRNPQKRLGAGKHDANEIKEHVFFQNVDWDLVFERGNPVPPPDSKRVKQSKIPLEEVVYGKYAKFGGSPLKSKSNSQNGQKAR